MGKLSHLFSAGNPWIVVGIGEAAGLGTNSGEASHCSGICFWVGSWAMEGSAEAGEQCSSWPDAVQEWLE